jgi:hypothetical protein
MRLNSYLSHSRHGIFYFRWPLPSCEFNAKRASFRMSLRTRCPKRAGQLARHLASCGDAFPLKKASNNMRHDELKALVHEYFKNALATQLDRLGASGPMTEQELAPLRNSQALAEASDDEFWSILHPEGSDAFLRQFCTASGIPQSEVTTNPERVMREYKLAYRDMLRTWERHRQSLDAYDYTDKSLISSPKDEPTSTAAPALTLQQAIDEYVYEGTPPAGGLPHYW